MALELTARQKAFLARLRDLCAEARGPLHYSRVAENLGVSAATAYDMLKVLERKGMVRSEYVIPDRPPGPGRASVLFAPTPLADEVVGCVLNDVTLDEEWETVRRQVLTALRSGEAAIRNDLLRDVAALVPNARSPLAYAGEVITVLLLNLHEAKHKFGPRSPLGMLLENTAGKLGMSMLAGLAFGLSATHRAHERLWTDLPKHIRRYEAAVQELSAERVQALREFVGEVVSALQATGR